VSRAYRPADFEAFLRKYSGISSSLQSDHQDRLQSDGGSRECGLIDRQSRDRTPAHGDHSDRFRTTYRNRIEVVGANGFEPSTSWSRRKWYKTSKCRIWCRIRDLTTIYPALELDGSWTEFLAAHIGPTTNAGPLCATPAIG
jgi:hypothetical protein